MPQDDAFNTSERDRQLAVAMVEALVAVHQQGSSKPAFGPRLWLAPGHLPPRV